MLVAQVFVETAGGVDLEDLRAEVAHVDAPGDGVGAVHRVFEHQVRVAGLELDLRQGLEEFPGVDLALADARIGDHLRVFLADADVGEGHAIDPLHVVGREEVHVGIALGQLEGDVGNHHAEGQGLDADLLVGVLALGIEEPEDVRMVGVEIDRPGALARPQLVGVGEGVFQELHDRDDAGGLVLDTLDRCPDFAHLAQQEGHAAATLGELQRRIHRAADGLHVVFDAQEEAGHQLPALALAGVEKGRGGRLEAPADHLVHQGLGQAFVTTRQTQGDHAHPILVAFQVALAVEGLEGVAGVVLEGAEKALETEFVGIGALEQRLHEGPGVLLQHRRLVVALVHQIAEFLVQVMEEHRVLVDVLQEVLPRRLAVLVELQLAIGTIEIEHGVECVIVRVAAGRGQA